jgi:hypothetical protein
MINLAVTTTVKNDYCFILEFINYYKKIGFDKIIIFDDGSSESFLNKIPKDNCVSVIKKNKSYELTGVYWLEKIRNRYDNSFDVRKRFNTYYACNLLKKDGFDWLFSCDTDEFVGSFKDEGEFDLKRKLRNINVPQVLFLARDIVFNPKKKLFENTKFRSLGIHDYWFGKFYEVLLSKFKSPLINKFYKVISNLIFGKKITNIKIGDSNFIIPINPSYLGHKSLINLNYYDNKHFNIHYWEHSKTYRKLPYKVLGVLYHFDLLSSKQVYKKFRKRTDTVAFNGPEYRNILESKAKALSFREFNAFYNNYMYTYNNVDTIEIKQIMNLLKK